MDRARRAERHTRRRHPDAREATPPSARRSIESKQDVEDYLNNALEADAETNARELVDAIEEALGPIDSP